MSPVGHPLISKLAPIKASIASVDQKGHSFLQIVERGLEIIVM
jgi:hypothetical protein